MHSVCDYDEGIEASYVHVDVIAWFMPRIISAASKLQHYRLQCSACLAIILQCCSLQTFHR